MRKMLVVLISFVFVFVAPVVPQQQKSEDFLVYVVGMNAAAPIVKALKKKILRTCCSNTRLL